MSNNAPNPVDVVSYLLIDRFNRAGDISTNPTPTLGADWSAGSSGNIKTNAAGYLEFDAATSITDYATYKAKTVGNKIAFTVKFGGVGKALFINLRSSGGSSFSGIGTSIAVRIKDDGVNFVYRVREQTDGAFVETVLETAIPGASLVGLNEFPVFIEDTETGFTIIIADAPPITVETTFGVENLFFQLQCAPATLNRISDLRIW